MRVMARKPITLVTSSTRVATAPTANWPFEPKPDVDQDHQQADAEGEQAVAEQLVRDGRADGISLLDGGARLCLGEGVADAADDLLGAGLGGLAVEADEHVLAVAEALQTGGGDLVGVEGFADLGEVGGGPGCGPP